MIEAQAARINTLTIELGIFAMEFEAGTSERRTVKRAHDTIEAQAARIKEIEAEKART